MEQIKGNSWEGGKRYEDMLKMAYTINPETNKYYTSSDIGRKHGLSRERIRQILGGNVGKRNEKFSEIKKPKNCQALGCKVVFHVAKRDSKYCSLPCRDKGRLLKRKYLPGVEVKSDSSEYRREVYRQNTERYFGYAKRWREKLKLDPVKSELFREKVRVYHLGWHRRNRVKVNALSRENYRRELEIAKLDPEKLKELRTKQHEVYS